MPIPYKSEEQSHKLFLKRQVEMENAIVKLHRDTELAIKNIIDRNTDLDGTIAKWKIDKIVDDYMASELNDYRKSLQMQIKIGVANSSDLGMKSILGAVGPQKKVTAFIWKHIVDKVRAKIINQKSIEDGLTLSDRVWKITDDNIFQLKKIISGDILQGKSAGTISRDVRGYLRQPETLRGKLKDLLKPGQGVYKSAYQNSMRVARTETSRAYADAQKETADVMGYKLQLQLSGAHKVEDICDEYAGKVFSPEDFPAPIHPNCMCIALTVLS